MRNASSLQIALATAVCLCAIPACAQPQSTYNSPDTNYTTTRLNAVVVNSTDGKPVPRVLVTSPDRRMAAMTDSEGRFSFDLRRAGSQAESHVFSSFPPTPTPAVTTIPIQFQVRRPGYISDSVILHLPAIPPAEPEPTLQLKIVPAAVLTGHLYPDAGDLPANLSVQLRRKQIQNGVATWAPASTAPVNSRGEFRFADLRPSDYKLVAPASGSFPVLTQPPPDSIRGFRPAFYPNTSSIESAAPIHITAGETAIANLSLHSATFYSVTVPIANLNAAGFSVNLLNDLPGLYIIGDQQSAHGYLPNGDYDLRFFSQANATPSTPFPVQSTASMHVHVEGKAIRTEPAAFHPTFELPIFVRRDYTSNAPRPDPRSPSLTVVIQALQQSSINPMVPMNGAGDDGLRIENLSEGLFRIFALPQLGYVASATSGTTDLLREPLQILPGVIPRPIEIVLRDDSASLTAHLASDPTQPQNLGEQPVVIILCIPLDRPQVQPLVFAAQQNQIHMASLPPGRYLILASHSQSVQNIEYSNEEVVRALIPKGATVTLSANQKADIEVPLMPDGAN
jgi:hypothetical protein